MFGPLKSRLTVISLTLAMGLSCSTTKSGQDGDDDDDRIELSSDSEKLPFIKQAARGLALAVYWRMIPPSATDQGALEETLAKNLSKSYGTQVEVFRRQGGYKTFDPGMFATMVEKGIDDVVVLELSQNQLKGQNVYEGDLKVIALNGNVVARAIALPAQSLSDAAPETFARRAWLEVVRSWTDPSEFPKLSELEAADRLAERGYCELAVRLYHRAFSDQSTASVTKATREHQSKNRMRHCQRQIALKKLRVKDAQARFELKKDLTGIAPHIRSAITKALPGSGLETELKKLSPKPALLTVQPGLFRITVRYHADRYAEVIEGRDKYFKGQPMIYFDPWEDLMNAALKLKYDAGEHLPPYDQTAVDNFRMALRLTTLLGDFLEIEFGEARSQVMVADKLRLHIGGRPDMKVAASAPRELRQLMFTLGAPRMVDGSLTDYGLVLRFMEIDS